MERYNCSGWLHITVDEDNRGVVGLRITHHQSHHPYTDISIPEDVKSIVEEMKNLPAAKVCWRYVANLSCLRSQRMPDLGSSPLR